MAIKKHIKKHYPWAILLLTVAGVGSFFFTLGTSEVVRRNVIHVVNQVTLQNPTSSKVTLVAAGDIACDPDDRNFNNGAGVGVLCVQQSTADLIGRLNPTHILPLGDLQYENGSYDKFKNSYDLSWGKYFNKTYPTPGNREYQTTDAKGYFQYFGARAGSPKKGYYSFAAGGWHIISLNSNCWAVGGCEKDSPQQRWLASELAKHKNKCVLAYWHHPRFSSGSHGDNQSMSQIWNDLYTAGADLVLSGHDHDYERFAPLDQSGQVQRGGMREIVVGTGGRGLYGFSQTRAGSEVRSFIRYGVLMLGLDKTSYSWQFVDTDSRIVDAGSGTCR